MTENEAVTKAEKVARVSLSTFGTTV